MCKKYGKVQTQMSLLNPVEIYRILIMVDLNLWWGGVIKLVNGSKSLAREDESALVKYWLEEMYLIVPGKVKGTLFP